VVTILPLRSSPSSRVAKRLLAPLQVREPLGQHPRLPQARGSKLACIDDGARVSRERVIDGAGGGLTWLAPPRKLDRLDPTQAH
jgi:hypothetical protein